MSNDNRDFNNSDHRRAYIRQCDLELQRQEKASSPLASLTDRGIDLTSEEEADVRAYADKMDVSFEFVAENVAAGYTIIGDRHNTKLLEPLARAHTIPRNTLALTLKCLISLEAGRIKRRKSMPA